MCSYREEKEPGWRGLSSMTGTKDDTLGLWRRGSGCRARHFQITGLEQIRTRPFRSRRI